jgi:hypothetical protein
VVPTTLSMEDLLRLWNTFTNRPFKVSLAYQVAAVELDSLQPPIQVTPVAERNVRYTRIP